LLIRLSHSVTFWPIDSKTGDIPYGGFPEVKRSGLRLAEIWPDNRGLAFYGLETGTKGMLFSSFREIQARWNDESTVRFLRVDGRLRADDLGM
jgi:acetyl-CoA carboxylase carboxyltransferase component